MTLSANLLKIHFLEFCQTNIYQWPAHNSVNLEFDYSLLLIPPHPRIFHCSKNVMFCFHWWLTIHQCQNSGVTYIPLLCRIWPDFIQKSSLFYQQSLGKIQTRVPNSQFTWWQDQSYSSANYIHCSAKLSVTVHNSHPKLFYLSVLAQRLSFRFFFSRGSSLE